MLWQRPSFIKPLDDTRTEYRAGIRESADARARRVSAPRGFTFIEMMVVVTIAGILGGLSIGKISAYMTQQRVIKASASLTNDLQQAFIIAARTRKPVRVVLDTARMELSITDRAQASAMRKRSLSGAYGLTSKNISFYPSVPLEIYPNGLAADTMAISLRASGTSRYIRVSRAGMVQVMVK
jgi:prepilin-type N-terminal cleavage/methylation domain-containing protein